MTLPLHRAWVHIDLGALRANYTAACQALPPHLQVIAVVKGNAYGHGLPQVAACLASLGVTHFAVATLSEAAQLRQVCPSAIILMLSPLFAWELPEALQLGVIPVVSSLAEAQMLAQAATQAGISLPVQLKVDTGLARAGVWHTQALPVLQFILATSSLSLYGVFSHLAAGGDPAFTTHQRQLFSSFLSHLPALPALVHLDASDGFETFASDFPSTAVRLGQRLFGLASFSPGLPLRAPVQPVFSLHARVALLKDLPAGTTVGYKRTHTLATASRIAILAAGYLDGIPSGLSNRGHVLLGGQLAPIIGRVTMDMTILDVTHLPQVAVGDVATVIGTQGSHTIGISDIMSITGQGAWEVLHAVSARVPRVFV